MYSGTFLFGSNDITESVLFTKEREYGFVDQEHLEGKTRAEQAIYSGGWNLRPSAQGEWKSAFVTTTEGVKIRTERFVLIFKVLVPEEGTYRVTVKTKAGPEKIRNMMLFAGRRNLIERNIAIEPDTSYHKEFLTYVSPYIPSMTSVPCTEKAIYISITGQNAGLSEVRIEKTDSRVLFIAGDSTVADQNALFPYYPYGSCGGWGQMMAQYFDSVAVCNQAHSGLTTNCFRDDGHWDIMKERIRENDIVMFQFGHNDQKRRNLSAFGGYLTNLRWYVKEIRRRGAYPVLLSPISRIPFQDEGRPRSLLKAHAEACRAAAEECNVPFIDLHTLTFRLWCGLGEEAHDYIMQGDITHTNDYGAARIAGFVASEIAAGSIEPLSGLPSDPEKRPFLPDQDTKEVPAKPEDNGTVRIPYVDIQGIPQYRGIEEAFRRGLLDPCVMHLHPYDTMPRAQFLMIYFKALRITGKRPYLGEYCDISRYEWDSSYVQACVEKNLIDPVTVPDGRFRPDDAMTQAEFASFTIRGMRKENSGSSPSLEECLAEAVRKGIVSAGAKGEEAICRADCYAGLARMMELMGNGEMPLPADAEIHPVG